MRRLLLLTPLLLAGTCPAPTPGTANAPTFRIEHADADFIAVRFKNACVAPTGTCKRGVLIKRPTGVAFSVEAPGTQAVVYATGLVSEGQHVVSTYHVDAAGRPTYGDKQIPWTTDKRSGASSPKIIIVSPAESLVPNTVYLEGSDFTAANVSPVYLVHPETGARRVVTAFDVKPNRVAISLPSGVAFARETYHLKVWGGAELDLRSDKVTLQGGLPADPRQKVQIAAVALYPAAACLQNGTDDNGKRFACGCRLTERWDERTREVGLNMSLDPYLDGWLNEGWSTWVEHFEDASREIQTACSETWGTAPNRIGGLYETFPRVHIGDGRKFSFNIDETSEETVDFARRERLPVCWWQENLGRTVCAPGEGGDEREEFCTTTVATDNVNYSYRFAPPPDCTNWPKAGATQVVVVIAGELWEDGRPIPPSIQRGIANPPTDDEDYDGFIPGLVILSDNPAVGARVKEATRSVVIGGQVITLDECVNDSRVQGDPVREVYPIGSSRPVLLFHELVAHILLGLGHPFSGADPCFTPLVGAHTESCPRGPDMAVGGFTPAANCGLIVNGLNGRDFSRLVNDDAL